MAVIEIAVPGPGPDEALIEVLLAGICNTDLELHRGYYGFRGVPGHEFVGRVVASPDPGWSGRRVVGEINIACGHCDFCRRNLGRHCSARSVLGIVKHPGAFARYVTLPISNLHAVPDHVPDEVAVFVEPVAAACEILDQIPVAGQQVAVLGDGKLGLLIAQVLQVSGAKVKLIGRHQQKLALAAERGIEVAGADATFPCKFPVVVECTGSAEGLKRAIKMVEPRGTVVMKSTVHETVALDMAEVIVNEISLVGSRCGRFEPAIELLAQRKIEVENMIQGEYPLSQASDAFASAASNGTLKILLRPIAENV